MANVGFEVTAPAKGDKWVNGQTYPISWEKGLFDGVDTFDIELSRMSKSGLILVAKDGGHSNFRRLLSCD